MLIQYWPCLKLHFCNCLQWVWTVEIADVSSYGSDTQFQLLRSLQNSVLSLRSCVIFHRVLFFYGKLLAHCLITRLQDCSFTATFPTWKSFYPPAARGYTMPWWQEIHLTFRPSVLFCIFFNFFLWVPNKICVILSVFGIFWGHTQFLNFLQVPDFLLLCGFVFIAFWIPHYLRVPPSRDSAL